MDKAYDVKALAEQLKAKGLDIAEESLKIVAEELLVWLENSATISPNNYDDLIKVVIPMVKGHILKAIDKIDGKEG